MYFLEDSGLRASVLDPAADRDLLGSRYCAGGYVWQIEDDALGPLLSGPAYPDAPKPFDGQGLPEAFETALNQDRAKVGDEVWVIGVGAVRRESPVRPFHVRDNPSVIRFADWDVVPGRDTVEMVSRQTFGTYDLRLRRKLGLRNGSLESVTSIANVGEAELPVRWFAHPFFPLAGEKCFRFSLEISMPENSGYRLGEDGFVERKPEYPWERGCFQTLAIPFGYPLHVEQKHPSLGTVRVDCLFPVARLPIWGNHRTMSFEPYYHNALAPGAEARWSIAYRFR